MAKDKGLKVTFAADPSLPESVVGDGNRLLQVLLNVVRGGRGEDEDDIRRRGVGVAQADRRSMDNRI